MTGPDKQGDHRGSNDLGNALYTMVTSMVMLKIREYSDVNKGSNGSVHSQAASNGITRRDDLLLNISFGMLNIGNKK